MKFISQRSSNSVLSKRVIVWTMIFSACLITAYVSFIETANAGLFSFVSSMFGEQASAKTTVRSAVSLNSQSLALLQAAVNRDPNPEKNADIIPVEHGNVLVADIATQDTGTIEHASSQISTYVVRSGDTLSGIAEMFDVSVNTIIWANDLSKGSALKVGQKLVILPVSGIKYTVKKGDTISGIVSRYKADLSEVLEYNDLTATSALTLGQSIIIPDAELSNVSSGTKIGDSKSSISAPAGYYMRPISGGYRSQAVHGHNGIDLAAPVGTPIYASAGGTVIVSKSSGWNGGYGNFVIISHQNGTQTLYSHMSKVLATVGETVKKGDQIGAIGMTGITTGPHIHFEVRGAKNPF